MTTIFEDARKLRQLRNELPEGYTVRYRHRRMAAGDDPRFARKMNYIPPEWPGPKGGETEAKVYGPDDSLVAIGIATCHERDNFNRRIGRDIALGRALKQLAEKTPVSVEELDDNDR